MKTHEIPLGKEEHIKICIETDKDKKNYQLPTEETLSKITMNLEVAKTWINNILSDVINLTDTIDESPNAQSSVSNDILNNLSEDEPGDINTPTSWKILNKYEF